MKRDWAIVIMCTVVAALSGATLFSGVMQGHRRWLDALFLIAIIVGVGFLIRVLLQQLQHSVSRHLDDYDAGHTPKRPPRK